jgi:hypothetical protein
MMKLLLAGALTISAFPALPQAFCAPRTDAIAMLAEGYGETREAIALGAAGQVVEVFANLDTRTWTILITGANGIACLAASGQNYERTWAPPAAGDPT